MRYLKSNKLEDPGETVMGLRVFVVYFTKASNRRVNPRILLLLTLPVLDFDIRPGLGTTVQSPALCYSSG